MIRKLAHNAIVICSAVLFVFVTCSDADARPRAKRQYATSTKPYWNVGEIDKELSRACQRGEFKQRKSLHLSIGYLGAVGKGITGVATDRWNLIDRKGLSKADHTYHFFHQGYSDCKVYVARTPPKTPR